MQRCEFIGLLLKPCDAFRVVAFLLIIENLENHIAGGHERRCNRATSHLTPRFKIAGDATAHLPRQGVKFLNQFSRKPLLAKATLQRARQDGDAEFDQKFQSGLWRERRKIVNPRPRDGDRTAREFPDGLDGKCPTAGQHRRRFDLPERSRIAPRREGKGVVDACDELAASRIGACA